MVKGSLFRVIVSSFDSGLKNLLEMEFLAYVGDVNDSVTFQFICPVSDSG